jgi:hypothetical protein
VDLIVDALTKKWNWIINDLYYTTILFNPYVVYNNKLRDKDARVGLMRVLCILSEIVEEFEALKIGFFKYFHGLLLYVRNHM